MVLGFLRRRKGKPDRSGQAGPASTPVSTASSGDLTGSITGPVGRVTSDGYIPDPRELAAAVPIPPVGEWWNPEDVGLSWDEAGWPIVARKEWRPRRAELRGASARDRLEARV